MFLHNRHTVQPARSVSGARSLICGIYSSQRAGFGYTCERFGSVTAPPASRMGQPLGLRAALDVLPRENTSGFTILNVYRRLPVG